MYFTIVSAFVLVTDLVSTFLYVACCHLSVFCHCFKAIHVCCLSEFYPNMASSMPSIMFSVVALLNYIVSLILEASCESCFMTFVFVVVVVVLKESVPHLGLFDGILYNLLKEKWKHACRYRFDTKTM